MIRLLRFYLTCVWCLSWYLGYDLGEHHPRKDTPDSSGHRHYHSIYCLRAGCLQACSKAPGLIIDPEDYLIVLLWLYCLDVQIVEVVIYLGGNLGRHDEHSVRSEDKDPVVRLVASLLQLHRRLENDLDMFAQSLPDALGRVFADRPSPVHCWLGGAHRAAAAASSDHVLTVDWCEREAPETGTVLSRLQSPTINYILPPVSY